MEGASIWQDKLSRLRAAEINAASVPERKFQEELCPERRGWEADRGLCPVLNP